MIEFKQTNQNAGDMVNVCVPVDMVNLEPFQRRVVDERRELDKKQKALAKFIGSKTFDTLVSVDEQKRLIRQNSIMVQYSEVLGERIRNFE